MNEARRIQLETLRRWTPQARLGRGMPLTALCLAAREARLRRQHPGASEDELATLACVKPWNALCHSVGERNTSGPIRSERAHSAIASP